MFSPHLRKCPDQSKHPQGVRRPIWEDSLNVDGGKWIIRLKKGVADRLWEELVLGVVGDHFAHGSGPSSLLPLLSKY
jgi:hypothetical protein